MFSSDWRGKSPKRKKEGKLQFLGHILKDPRTRVSKTKRPCKKGLPGGKNRRGKGVKGGPERVGIKEKFSSTVDGKKKRAVPPSSSRNEFRGSVKMPSDGLS